VLRDHLCYLKLPRRKAPHMDVEPVQSWRGAILGELDLQFELVLRDWKLAHGAGSSDPRTAPHPIRCARGQLRILDSVSGFVAQQHFVSHTERK
jgi:hypothetical protein